MYKFIVICIWFLLNRIRTLVAKLCTLFTFHSCPIRYFTKLETAFNLQEREIFIYACNIIILCQSVFDIWFLLNHTPLVLKLRALSIFTHVQLVICVFLCKFYILLYFFCENSLSYVFDFFLNHTHLVATTCEVTCSFQFSLISNQVFTSFIIVEMRSCLQSTGVRDFYPRL